MRVINLFIATFLTSIWTLAWSVSARSEESEELNQIPPLSIEMPSLHHEETVAGTKLQFATVCKKFSEHLMKNAGLWGSGPFAKVSCRSRDSEKAEQPSFPFWKLTITGDDSRQTFALTFEESEKKSTTHAAYSIETPVSGMAIMAKKSAGELLAFYLVTAMPYRSIVKLTGRGDRPIRISGPSQMLAKATPPDTLALFALKRRKGLWIPTDLGELNQAQGDTKTQTWSVATKDLKEKRLPTYGFVQQISGRGETLAQTDQMIREELGSFAQKFLSLGRSAYVGARYGAPIRNDSALKNAPLFGYFAEFRSGILDGLKLSYDTVPERPFTDETGTTALTMTRFQIGYAIGRDVRWGFISHIDVAPKIGTTSIKATYVPSADVANAPLEFTLTRAPTLGLEIGLEKRALSFLFRAWGFGSFSVGILPLDRNNATSTLRGGLDVYRDLFSIKKINVAILGFGLIDSTSIVRRNVTEEQLEENPSLSDALKYKGNYAGAGLTLTW